jgi:hypothetical protein
MLKTVGVLDDAADGYHLKMGSRRIGVAGADYNDWPEGRNGSIGSKS